MSVPIEVAQTETAMASATPKINVKINKYGLDKILMLLIYVSKKIHRAYTPKDVYGPLENSLQFF